MSLVILEYSQLAQVRENSTNAVSIYSPAANETVQAFVKITNVTAVDINVRVFHDNDGTIYDETTALFWDTTIPSGMTLEIDHIFMNDSNGNLAYRSSTANALIATVYGIIRDDS